MQGTRQDVTIQRSFPTSGAMAKIGAAPRAFACRIGDNAFSRRAHDPNQSTFTLYLSTHDAHTLRNVPRSGLHTLFLVEITPCGGFTLMAAHRNQLVARFVENQALFLTTFALTLTLSFDILFAFACTKLGEVFR